MMHARRWILGFVVLVSLLVAAAGHGEPPAQARKLLAVEDLYRLDAPGSLVLSPDGKRAAFVRSWIDERSQRERSSLWLVEGQRERTRSLEKGEPDARSPVFSPDGKWLAFLSTRPRPDGWKQTPAVPRESEVATDVWLLPMDGGPSIPLAGPDKPYGRVFHDGFYGRLAFSADGRRLAFVADDGRDPRGPDEKEAHVHLVRPDQGEGYTGYGTAQVWIAHLADKPGRHAAARIERLTEDDVWYGDPQWSPDGRSLVVHANRTADRESVRYSINKNYDLWSLDVRTHALRQLTTGVGPEVSPRFAPDGKRLACLSIPRKGSHRDTFNLAIVTLGEGGARTEVLFDHHGPGAERAPHPAPSFPLPEDCWDGEDHLIYRAEKGTETITVRVNLRTGRGEVLKLPEQGSADTVAGRLRQRAQLMPRGNAILRERALGETRVVSWDNGEGMRIEGLFTTPPLSPSPPSGGEGRVRGANVARAPYPLVVYPHGGPHSRSARGFDFTVQTFAAHGYAVFQPNFRGSSGYGQKFIDADRSDFGGGDMRDILTGVDHLVHQKLVDPERQFVYGISYGGFMTCWLVGHTKQFRAATAQNAVTDLNVMWGRSDLPSWTEWEFGGRPWEVPAAMRRHSPITYVANVQTPTLILHSREDRRCPIVMGRMFHEALRARRIDTRMVVYPGEGHGIRQPRHRVDVLRRTLAWFAEHDKK
jgi:dipeptidyl aminopeptidase/acylaminoacyl peptidase